MISQYLFPNMFHCKKVIYWRNQCCFLMRLYFFLCPIAVINGRWKEIWTKTTFAEFSPGLSPSAKNWKDFLLLLVSWKSKKVNMRVMLIWSILWTIFFFQPRSQIRPKTPEMKAGCILRWGRSWWLARERSSLIFPKPISQTYSLYWASLHISTANYRLLVFTV